MALMAKYKWNYMNDERKLSTHFEFGKNWKLFLEGLDEKKINEAIKDIENFIGVGGVVGKSFTDIGCGSGLSSLAAYKLGASSVYSYDIDPLNIENVKSLISKYKNKKSFDWRADVKSIVENEDVKTFKKTDIVYAWGVLHHTGDMWSAISNSASLVEGGGLLYLMLYRDAKLAHIWKIIKKYYVNSSSPIKFIMRNAFAVIQIIGIIAKGKNPVKSIKNYGINSRGMSWYTDSTDWIGGYPFEYAEAEEVINYLKPLGFELIKIYPYISKKSWGLFGTGSYQYLFHKK
jgi:2-polyprenyl-6-hydroxyphenyl methylase/3-demethylubiquinone-9 3-methyltransferase